MKVVPNFALLVFAFLVLVQYSCSVPFLLSFISFSKYMKEKNWTMGLWKFSQNVSLQQLAEVANKWAVEDASYLQLYIRKVSKDQMGIGFTYQLPLDVPAKEAHDVYFEKTTDYLKRNFGNDLVGWDIASSVWVIK